MNGSNHNNLREDVRPDTTAMFESFTELAGQLRAAAMRICHNDADAQDALQTVALAIMRMPKVDHVLNRRAFLMTAVRNAVCAILDKRRATASLEAVPEVASNDAREQELSVAEKMALVEAIVRTFAHIDQAIFRLRREGLTQSDVAAQLGLTRVNVAKREQRMRLKLRQSLPHLVA